MNPTLAQIKGFHAETWGKVLLKEDLLKTALRSVLDSPAEIGRLRSKLKTSLGSLESWIEDQGGDLGVAPRIHNNALALAASCAAAAAFKSITVTCSMEESIRYVWETQGLLDPAWRAAEPKLSGMSGAHPKGSAPFSEFARSLDPQPTAALYWTAYWLQDADYLRQHLPSPRYAEGSGQAGVIHRVQVLLSAFVEGAGRRGGIWPLELETVAGGGVPLFEHPESALFPFADDWIETLRCAAGISRSGEKPKPGLKHPICWRVHHPTGVPMEFRKFSGTSHGGAAVRALWHLALGKYPDPGVLVMASIKPDGLTGWFETDWNHPAQNLVLAGVNGITEKVLAAADAEEIDTIVVVNEFVPEGDRRVNNAIQAREVLDRHPRSSKIQLIELD